ncbi:hypothetical protein BJ138DRAFT_1139469 [Hygrophoropsis aurantiaca]|uniref:Uncharacterized protein n=1 Tax=Hygrophoropsis aurantiaca TaxID=72124 RepID=A0ACB8ATD1_9AGAM|nr:hypothetical protein BJ138DRAFT_1139469 [Hygrophoropsis aurantiaca]
MEFASSTLYTSDSLTFQSTSVYGDDYLVSDANTAFHPTSADSMYLNDCSYSPESASSSSSFAMHNQRGAHYEHSHLFPYAEGEEGSWSLQDQSEDYSNGGSKSVSAIAQQDTTSYPYYFPITVSYTLAPALGEYSSSASSHRTIVKREQSSDIFTYDSQPSSSGDSLQTPSRPEWVSHSEFSPVGQFKQEQEYNNHFVSDTQRTYAVRTQDDAVKSHTNVAIPQQCHADYVRSEIERPHTEFEGPPMDRLPFPPNHSPSQFEFQSYSPVQEDTAASPSAYGSPTEPLSRGIYSDSWGTRLPSPAPITVPSQSYMFTQDTPSPVSAQFILATHPSQHHSHRITSSSHGHTRQGSPLRRSPSPRGTLPISPLPQTKRLIEKKPALACLFCRGRKIACGPPSPGNKDKTCNQCARRHLKCEYPLESRRGMRKRRSLMPRATARGTTPARDNINPAGPKVISPPRKRSVDKRSA